MGLLTEGHIGLLTEGHMGLLTEGHMGFLTEGHIRLLTEGHIRLLTTAFGPKRRIRQRLQNTLQLEAAQHCINRIFTIPQQIS